MKKGFTLVELLAVLVILGIILTITYYSVNSLLNNSEDSLSDTQEAAIIEAAKIYYLEEGMDLESGLNKVCVSVSYLINKGYIDRSEIKDPSSKNPINGYVIIENDNDKYTYKLEKSGIPSQDICNIQTE